MRCGLTLRSSGPPPAWHLAREPLQVIIRLAGQAPHRRRPLTSNVRPHVKLMKVLAIASGGIRRQIQNAATVKARWSVGEERAAWHAPRLQRLPSRHSPALRGGGTKPLQRLLSSVSPTSRLTAAERAFGRRSMVRAPVPQRVRLCSASATNSPGRVGLSVGAAPRHSSGCSAA